MADEQELTTVDDTMSRVMADIAKRESEAGAPVPAADASVEPAVSSSSAAPEATDTASGDRPRGPDGKFIAKTADAPATATPITDHAEPTATTAAPSTAQAVTPPVSWSAEAKAAWNALPPAVQQAALKREQEVSSGFAQKTAELKRYDALESVLGPRRAALAAEFGSEAQAVQTLFALSDYARQDFPGFVRMLAQQRGIDLASLAGTPVDQTQVSADPTIAALQQEIGTLKQNLQGFTAQQQQAQADELNRQIETFKADPKHTHFEAVRAHMAALMQGGQAKDMQDAYDQAVFANPTTRALVMEEQRKADEAKRAAEQARQVAEANRMKAANVATTGALGASPTKPGTWQETMDKRARELNAA
jgi:hypothetical protein